MSFRKERFDAWKRRPGRPTLVALLEAAQGRVFAICRDILRHREEAEEAAQETLLKIVEGIDQVTDAEHFERWIGMVATRAAIDRRRMLKRRQVRDLAGLARTPSGPVDGLQDALSRLPDEDRSLIVERYFERRTLEEMAGRRGLSDVAVRKRIVKAQSKLKRMLGGFLVLGVGAMKAKAAAIAVILIPLLLLGGGVVFVSRDKEPKTLDVSSNDPVPSERPLVVAAASTVAEPPRPADWTPRPGEVPDRARLRAQVSASLERLRYARGRAEECRHLMPESLTEEEAHALYRERMALTAEANELRKKLCDLAAQDPQNIVEMAVTALELPDRLTLMGLIAPDVESEIREFDAPSGPLLAGLLPLARGDVEERTHFAAFVGQVGRVNLELVRSLVPLIGDSEFTVRIHAMHTVLMHARRNADLRRYLESQLLHLKQAATRNDSQLENHVRGSALMVLASLDNEDADQFVLEQFESLDSARDYHRIEAAGIAGKRLAACHEARLITALSRAFQLPFQDHVHYQLLGVARFLSEESRRIIEPIAEANRPLPGGLRIPTLFPQPVAWQATRRFTGVNRWEFGEGTEPTVHRRP